MKNVFLNDEVLAAEKKIISTLNIPPLILMENAGANSAKYIFDNYPELINDEIIIVAGKGNNAGDGFVIARHLSNKKVKIKILILYKEKELKDEALVNFNIIKNPDDRFLKIFYCKDLKDLKKEIKEENKIIIDAIFGTGFKGILDIRMKSIIQFINELKGKQIISLDTPSGLFSYNQSALCIKATETLTMGTKKFHSLFYAGREMSGKLKVIDIGVSENEFTRYNSKKIFETTKSFVKKILPVRNINSNKYSSGKVFILSGSQGLTGATYLCSIAALRTGSGAVITGVPKSLNKILEVKLTEVMTLPLIETEDKSISIKCYDEIKGRLKWADTVLLGPGLSKNEETLELVRKIVRENDLNFVIDADGISAFKGNLKILKNRKIILTPHFGEFANLIDKNADEVKDNFFELSKQFAKENKVILVLKNSPSIVTDGDGFYINSTGRENLATAGTGDVLSGIISGLFSQSKNILNSALAGVYIHGKCGDNLYSESGPDSMIAGDLINEIPKVKIELKQT